MDGGHEGEGGAVASPRQVLPIGCKCVRPSLIRGCIALLPSLQVLLHPQWGSPVYPATLFACAPLLPTLQVLLHPQWGSAVYPATMFTCAPLESLQAAIKQAEANLLK